VAEVILILRTYALYDLSKRILIFLASIFFGHVTIMVLATMKAHKYALPHGFIGIKHSSPGLPLITPFQVVRSM
jgi:nitric oxide reductase large subunit